MTKKLFSSIVCFLLLTSFKIPSAKGTIIVKINNCRSDNGLILIALYNSEQAYMNESKAIEKKIISIKDQKATIKFENIPYGQYAFVFFHDENKNTKLDKNFMGIPKEGYGFSNAANGTFGPPSFSKSKFELKQAELTAEVNMGYFF